MCVLHNYPTVTQCLVLYKIEYDVKEEKDKIQNAFQVSLGLEQIGLFKIKPRNHLVVKRTRLSPTLCFHNLYASILGCLCLAPDGLLWLNCRR